MKGPASHELTITGLSQAKVRWVSPVPFEPYTGSGYVNYDDEAGSYIEWTVNAARAGTQKATFRFSVATAAARPMDISVNGVVVLAGTSFPSTGGGAGWQMLSVRVPLRAGVNTHDGKVTYEAVARSQDLAYVPLDRLALSPQCGFASTMEGNRISMEDQRRKLELVAGVARDVWGES